MTALLQINASIPAHQGQSSPLSAAFVTAFERAHPHARIVIRDLALEPLPHLSAARFAALLPQPEQRGSEQRAVAEYSDRLIGELRQADVIVLGLPMYNSGVPSQLKAHFDHIARAGETLRYTAADPVGPLRDKKAYVFATRGGLYAGTALDTQTAYVRDFLRFVGIEDIEFVYAEGLAISPQSKASGLARVTEQIARLAA